MGKGSPWNKWCRNNWIFTCKKNLNLHASQKLAQKELQTYLWYIGLQNSPKITEEEKNIMTLSMARTFYAKHQRHDPWNKLLIRWSPLKFKSSAMLKTIKAEATNWKNIFAKLQLVKNDYPRHT
jgi:hypothetical protein